jgi:hypothetical protein
MVGPEIAVGTLEVVLKLLELANKGDKKDAETLLTYVKAAQMSVAAISLEGQQLVALAAGCDLSDKEGVKALKERMHKYLYTDTFRGPLNDATAGMATCLPLIHPLTAKIKAFLGIEKDGKRLALQSVEESLRGFQSFLMSLSQSGVLDPVSGLPFVFWVYEALESGDQAAMQAAVFKGLKDPNYTGWMEKTALAQAAAAEMQMAFG